MYMRPDTDIISKEDTERIRGMLYLAISGRTLSKLVMSRARDKAVLRSCAALYESSGELFVSLETFLRDGKAIRKNHPASEAALEQTVSLLTETALCGYRQINLICEEMTAEILVSDKGKLHITETKKRLARIDIPSHNRVKRYLLEEGKHSELLIKLGLSDQNGKLHDKKRAKFRQINRFLDHIDAIYGELPRSGELCVCDLCCGKSYLTFAAYWYLTVCKGRSVAFYGVDLKADVIDYCASVAEELGWTGMHFSVGDVSLFTPPRQPDLVMSLHACDIATDYVLAGAVRTGARVILSTPCCHHELNRQISCPELDIICRHSMLKQKLADAATDALRAQMLELCSYQVTVCELIDPEETPKNLLIRAVKRREKLSDDESSRLLSEYDAACRLLGVTPSLRTLLLGQHKASCPAEEERGG